jgi:uracil-DNA glycosylase family 4
MCELCPLNGQRKVGCDGPPKSKHLAIGEAPGVNEEEDGIAYGRPYGRPFKGKAGYLFKLEMLVAAELATAIDQGEHRWPRVTDPKVWFANLIMCRPPKNKITTKEGKKAVVACGESLKKLVLMILRADVNRTLDPMGAYPTSFLMGKSPADEKFKAIPIDSYRGYEMGPYDLAFYEQMLAPMDPIKRLKYLLRGKKPPKEFVGLPRKEWSDDPEVRMAQMGWKNHLMIFMNMVKKAARDAEKKAAIDALPAEITEWAELWKAQKKGPKREKKRDDTGSEGPTRRGRKPLSPFPEDGESGDPTPRTRRPRKAVVRISATSDLPFGTDD